MIASELGLSPKTVATHRANLMRKLQLRNIAAVTLYAIKNGLVGSNPHGIACQPPDIGFASFGADSAIGLRSGNFGC